MFKALPVVRLLRYRPIGTRYRVGRYISVGQYDSGMVGHKVVVPESAVSESESVNRSGRWESALSSRDGVNKWVALVRDPFTERAMCAPNDVVTNQLLYDTCFELDAQANTQFYDSAMAVVEHGGGPRGLPNRRCEVA